MIDTEHDSIGWSKIASWLSVAVLGGLWWWSIFARGFGITMIWTIVVIALYAIWLRVSGRA